MLHSIFVLRETPIAPGFEKSRIFFFFGMVLCFGTGFLVFCSIDARNPDFRVQEWKIIIAVLANQRRHMRKFETNDKPDKHSMVVGINLSPAHHKGSIKVRRYCPVKHARTPEF